MKCLIRDLFLNISKFGNFKVNDFWGVCPKEFNVSHKCLFLIHHLQEGLIGSFVYVIILVLLCCINLLNFNK